MDSLPNQSHHLVQSNPVPGAAEEVWGGGVADQNVVLRGPQALMHQGDHWDKYHRL